MSQSSYELVLARLGSGLWTKEVLAGEALDDKDLVYIDVNGRARKADASSMATMPAVGIVQGDTEEARSAKLIMGVGFIGSSAWAWTPGNVLYVSTVAGLLTATAPAGPTDIVQEVAVVIEPDLIYILPGLGGATPALEEVKEFFTPAPSIDDARGATLTDGVSTQIAMTFTLPMGYHSGWSVDVLLIPGGTGNLRRSVATNFGEVCAGEAYDTHSDSIAAGQVAVTQDELECIDITTALTGATERDQVSMTFTREGGNASDTVNADVYVAGVLVRKP